MVSLIKGELSDGGPVVNDDASARAALADEVPAIGRFITAIHPLLFS